MTKTNKLAVSGMVIALYVTTMSFTQSFAFGPYQIRVATSLYSLSYLYPFLVIPLGISNCLSNLVLGGLGLPDILGGVAVGLITSSAVYLIAKFNKPKILVIPIIIAGPGLIVPIWLSAIFNLPYPVLALNLCVGQILPAITGWLFIGILEKLFKKEVLSITSTK